MPSLEEITASIEARIAALRSDIASLEAARAQLRDGSAPAGPASASAARTASTTPRTSPTRRTRTDGAVARKRRKSPEVLLADRLETMLRESADGLGAAAIARSANARDAQVRTLLRELEGSGQVRRTGAGRGTRWRLITDEERIAERAAELAKLSRSRSRT